MIHEFGLKLDRDGQDGRLEDEMDASISIKPPPVAGKSLAARDPVTVREAAATDLGPAKAVTAPGDRGTGHRDPHPHGQRQDGSPGEHPERAPADVLANPESRDVLYRERDIRAEDRAHPDQALLRQRAYRPAAAAVADTAPDPHADLKA